MPLNTFRDNPIEAVIFDWGGTLATFATSVSARDLWTAAAEQLSPHTPEETAAIAELLATVENSFWARTTSEHPYSGTLADLVADAHQQLKGDVPDSVLSATAKAYLDAWAPHIEHEKDAVPMLDTLRAQGIRTALLSNTHWPRQYHEQFLRRDGLDGLLDARLYTSDLDYMKPHPSVFGAALAAIEVEDASRALFVGDRLWDDIFGAQRAGLRTALRINPLVPKYDVEPDIKITQLSELIGHLRE